MLKFSDGNEYDGEFVENECHGKGKYKFNDRREFEGQWENNMMKGFGTLKVKSYL